MKHDPSKKITVGDLREHLELFPDDFELIFGDEDLSFYRTKRRGPKQVQIEFNEIYTVKEPG